MSEDKVYDTIEFNEFLQVLSTFLFGMHDTASDDQQTACKSGGFRGSG